MDKPCVRNCENCPIIGILLEKHAEMSELESQIVNHAAGEELDDMAEQVFDRMNEVMGGVDADTSPRMVTPDGIVEVESAEDISSAIRKGAAHFSGHILEDLDDLNECIDDTTSECPGPVTMQARHAGLIVRTTACLSPLAPTDPVVEPARVHRRIEDQ